MAAMASMVRSTFESGVRGGRCPTGAPTSSCSPSPKPQPAASGCDQRVLNLERRCQPDLDAVPREVEERNIADLTCEGIGKARSEARQHDMPV